MTTFADCYRYTWQNHFKRQAQAPTTSANYKHIVGVSRPISDLSRGGWWTELDHPQGDRGCHSYS